MKKQWLLSLPLLLIPLALFAFESNDAKQHLMIPQFALVDKSILTSGNLEIEDKGSIGARIYKQTIQHYDEDPQNPERLSGNKETNEEAAKTENDDSISGRNDASLYYNLGVSFNNAGMNKHAVEAYKKAIELNPDYIDAHYHLALSYLTLNDTDAAHKKYMQLKTLAPQIAENLHKHAAFLASSNILNGYIVQVGAYKDLNNANELVEKIKSDYLYVYIDKKNELNKVKIHGIKTKKDANLIIREISEKMNLKAYLVRKQ